MIEINKQKEQEKAKNAWISNECRGTCLMCTGSGKSLLALLCIDHIIKDDKNKKAILIVSRENLIEQFRKEMYKWNMQHLVDRTTIVCLQTAYKIKDFFDIQVIDECHNALSAEYSSVFTNIKSDALLCLSAKIKEDSKSELLNSFAPVVHETTVKTALELKLISEFQVYNLAVELNEQEKETYQKNDSKYETICNEFGGKFNAFNRAKRHLFDYNQPLLRKLALDYFSVVRQRKSICDNAKNKYSAVLDIYSKFGHRKILIFSQNIKTALAIKKLIGNECEVYHSKQTKQQRAVILEKFNKGTISVLSSVKALNEGLDVPDCSLAINFARDSSSLVNVQKIGRICRRTDDYKLALFINLYTENTKEIEWLNKSLDSVLNINWVKNIDEINEI